MTVFFDIDDTLYDRGLPFISAAEKFFGGAVSDPREAYRCCTRRGNEVFLPSQRGEISMDEMYIYRWGKGFEDVGISISPAEALSFQQLYRSMQNKITLSPVIEKLLTECAGRTDRLGIITNGPLEKQWNKIARLGLERFFHREMIIISGDIKIDKPDPEIFRLAEKRSGTASEEIYYAGDSLFNDIYPASACGWHTIWFNRDGKSVPAHLPAEAIANTEEEFAVEILKII